MPVHSEHLVWAQSIRAQLDRQMGPGQDVVADVESRNAGHLAELLFAEWCRRNDVEHQWLYDAIPGAPDFTIGRRRWTVEVKTQTYRLPPLPHWSTHIGGNQVHKAFDFLLFCSYDRNGGALHIIGAAEREEYFSRATLVRPGELIPGTNRAARNTASFFAPRLDWLYPVADFVRAVA